MNEAKMYVLEGLERRKADWRTREQQLDSYEEEMITACNQHSANTKKIRDQEEIRRIFSAERRAAQRAAQVREQNITFAVKQYILFCLVTMMVTTWTPLEWWAAAALIMGAAVFPAVYIFRQFYPLEEVKK